MTLTGLMQNFSSASVVAARLEGDAWRFDRANPDRHFDGWPVFVGEP